nr:MAG TPA: hypothetical protein [Bacteriophage sp.]
MNRIQTPGYPKTNKKKLRGCFLPKLRARYPKGKV